MNDLQGKQILVERIMNMKVVIAMDSFKGSMTTREAGNAAKEGILKVCNAEVTVLSMADGGEGTTRALVDGLGGTYVRLPVTGPLGELVTAEYGILEDGKTAVMEMAQAAGITLIDRRRLDPWLTTSFGAGEMILDGFRRGCRKFIIGIGGSATTEGGTGMLQALGYEFYDAAGRMLPPVFKSLGRIERISGKRVPEGLKECHFQIACDVTNPLCGDQGAIAVFGPQKGVKIEEIIMMDAAMKHYAEKVAQFTGRDMSRVSGAGAAGGMGFAFRSFMPQAQLKSGAAIVREACGLEKELADADIVITGEGRLDAQTAMGKVPADVAKLAKKYGCMVLAFAGSVTEDAGMCNGDGIDAFFPAIRSAVTLDEAMNPENARKNMSLLAEQVFRLITVCGPGRV